MQSGEKGLAELYTFKAQVRILLWLILRASIIVNIPIWQNEEMES